MGIRPRKSSSRGPGALLGRLALSGRDRLYRPRVAYRGACPHAHAQWCRGACPHAQARAQEYAAEDRAPLHPEIAAEDRPPLQLRSRDRIALVALKQVRERSVKIRVESPTLDGTEFASSVKFRLTSCWPSVSWPELRKTNYSLLLI